MQEQRRSKWGLHHSNFSTHLCSSQGICLIWVCIQPTHLNLTYFPRKWYNASKDWKDLYSSNNRKLRSITFAFTLGCSEKLINSRSPLCKDGFSCYLVFWNTSFIRESWGSSTTALTPAKFSVEKLVFLSLISSVGVHGFLLRSPEPLVCRNFNWFLKLLN